jgi:hypothetical protein
VAALDAFDFYIEFYNSPRDLVGEVPGGIDVPEPPENFRIARPP